MRIINLIIVLFMSAFITACGGGGDSQIPEEQSQVQDQPLQLLGFALGPVPYLYQYNNPDISKGMEVTASSVPEGSQVVIGAQTTSNATYEWMENGQAKSYTWSGPVSASNPAIVTIPAAATTGVDNLVVTVTVYNPSNPDQTLISKIMIPVTHL